MEQKIPHTRKILFVTDATASMDQYLIALKESLWEVLNMMSLLGDFEFGIFWYRDYCDPKVTGFSGFTTNYKSLYSFIDRLRPSGGGDPPEATKTALFEISKFLDDDSIIFFYTDAPPHTELSAGKNYEVEKKTIPVHDWVELAHNVKGHIFNFISNSSIVKYHSYLGECFMVTSNKQNISNMTMTVFLSLIGHYEEPIRHIRKAERVNNESELIIPDEVNEKMVPIIPKENLVTKFRSNSDFRKAVYNVFREIMVPSHIMILTTNPVFGLVWREICRSKTDEKEQLILALGNCVNLLPSDSKKVLQAWIAESYNSIEEIKETITKVPEQLPAVINLGGTLSREEVLLITRECNSKSVRNVIRLLSELSITETKPEQDYLPIGLENDDLFSTLPHLIAPGLKFSRRASLFVALLCYVNDNIIFKERAEGFLRSNIGTWYDKDAPENYTYEFMSWWLKAPQFLTDDERQRFTLLTDYSSLLFNMKSRVDVTISYTPNGEYLPDHKRECNKCKKSTSYSLLLHNGTCVFCAHEYVPDCESGPAHSHLYSCRICSKIYAVQQPQKLRCNPKCYYCRGYIHQKGQTCKICTNTFVSFIPFDTCQVCATGGPGTITMKVPIQDLIAENGVKIYHCLGFELSTISNNERSLFAIAKVIVPIETTETLYYKNKIIQNDVIVEIKKRYNDVEKTTCYLCGETKIRQYFDSACNGCAAEACTDCLKAWYGQLYPGKIAQINHLSCPFCKRISGKALKKYNKEALLIHKQVKVADPNFYHAWCIQCYKICEYKERSCSDGIPDVAGFICVECQNRPPPVAKKCPRCEIPTIKTTGCDHMTCPCGSHWCYHCGTESTTEEIYTHIRSEHREDE